ncbi:MAG: CHAT domain-containing protein [Acidobacteria bacterium]|nr:CHAT domain-containing protein [Acidobacteriota bacterium]
MAAHIFISHTSKDDAFVKELREKLAAHKLTVWDDAHKLRGGDRLKPEVSAAIETARKFIVVLSQNAIESDWVFDEINQALAVEQARKAEGYNVIPLLLPDFKAAMLKRLKVFPDERLGISIAPGPNGLADAMPQILAALGKELPADAAPPAAVAENPVAELLLELRNLKVETDDGKTRAKAEATLTFQPPEAGAREVKSEPFFFTSPLGPIESDDLRWYLEKFYQWPIGQFKERGERIAKQLPDWGRLLYQAALETESAQEALRGWLDSASKAERRFSVEVSDKLPSGSPPEAITSAKEAATLLLSLPWELLHDERGFLFHGKHAVRVRRRLPNNVKFEDFERKLPIRVLLVSPRPEDDSAAYIDHRVSSQPLVEAIETLGETVSLTILQTPTFPALQQALRRAQFDVVHFDGHGVFDPRVGLGKLCFEAPDQDDQLHNRKSELIDAERLAAVMRDHRIPLVFLEACQSAKTDDDPTASVAAKLLEQGVVSVVAMTHSVLVETARRFVKEFYRELAEGARIGAAMLAGQQALHADTRRGAIAGAGEFHLQDWFVPVLYQERQDPSLVRQRLSAAALEDVAVRRKFNLGELPDAPEHRFIGRSRELLALERLLLTEPYAVIRGVGGEGKTTLAVELARWLVRTNRFRRTAFVSLEQYSDAKGMADTIGRQLVGAGYSAGGHSDWRAAMLPIKRELKDKPTIIVVDNVESLFSPTKTHEEARRDENDSGETSGSSAESTKATEPSSSLRDPSCDFVGEVFLFCQALLDAHPATRIVFTSRELLPRPFARRDRVIPLDRLSREYAVELVSRVMKRREYDEQGNTPTDIAELVEAVNRHARALTLLAHEVKASGVRSTTDNLRRLMIRLEKDHPGERENSLYASVALSLRRLPLDLGQQVKALAVFHGGAHLGVLWVMLGVPLEAVDLLATALIEVGLAEMMDYSHLRLDPALPNYLLAQMDAAKLPSLTARWAESMRALTGFLYQQRSQDAQLAQQLTLLELPNLLALLTVAVDTLPPERVVDLAGRIEDLLTPLGRPQALAQAVSVRATAARRLGAWSHAQVQNASNNINRLLEQGAMPEAFAAAQQLLARCQSAGADAYPEAAYDSAMAYFLIGEVLQTGGAAEEALVQLAEGQRRFQTLADTGEPSAIQMTAVAIIHIADCLRDLGRLDEALAGYQDCSERATKLGNQRLLANNKERIGTVRLIQNRYTEALEAHSEARGIFERLGEPGTVARSWHRIGMIHSKTEHFEQAEYAYRQALAINVRHKFVADEAINLGQLGILYSEMGLLEEAVKFCRQAVEIHASLQDQWHEGSARSNLAYTLIKLQRYDEARRELHRAIECSKTLGHAAKPWKTWEFLHDLEQATSHAQAAAEARGQAVTTYLAYRRADGESQAPTAPLYALVAQALGAGTPDALTAAAAQLAEGAQAAITASFTALLDKLQAVLRGERDPALAADPALSFWDVVELQLLLEGLG